MAQITLYLDDETESKMKRASREAGLSMSRWVVGLIQERTDDDWPPSVLSLAGSWADFPELDEIRSSEGVDVPRESF